MKPINYNKKITLGNIYKSIRPYSVNSISKKLYKSPINPANALINHPYYNKNLFNNNHNGNNNIFEINSYYNQRLTPFGHNNSINESNIHKNKQNYENLSVKIFNLYNIKDKNKPFSIKINNNSPKYYINNCINQLLLKKLDTKEKNKNIECHMNNKINNNTSNILSLVSPKYKTYKKLSLPCKTNENIINSKRSEKIEEIKIANKIEQNRKKKKLILEKYNDYSFTNIKQNSNENNYESFAKIKKFNDKNNSLIGIYDEYIYNFGNTILKNLNNKNYSNTNRKNIYNRVLNSNLTLENPKLMTYNVQNSRKNNKINNTKLMQFFPLKQNNTINNSSKIDMQDIRNKKQNKVFSSILDLKNNKFESETIKKIIKEFIEKEEKDSGKIELLVKKNKNYNKMIKNKISKQKQKYHKDIKDNDNVIINIPKNTKIIKNNDYEIYLQYNQNNCVDKILLNDKNGNITSFIPSSSKGKQNTIDNIKI